ncbi:MAG: ubiquinol-cytochrome c reductase iron-sulfur subunit [Pyrinomonadaceae bacterium]
MSSEKNPNPPGDQRQESPSVVESAVNAPATEASAANTTPDEKARAAQLIRAAAGLNAAGEKSANSEAQPGKVSVDGKTPAARAAAAGVGAKAVVAKPAPRTSAAVVETLPDSPINKMRRRVIWASVAGFLGVTSLAILRFFLPRTIQEPSSVFRIGFPNDYSIGVDTKWQQQFRIWVVRNPERMFVVYARCTHLGCTPDWKASENKFKCPCHGSGYDSEGVNFEGPAPRPMDRAHVEMDAQGQIVVDTNRLYEWPKGGENEFDEAGAFIQV